MVTNRSTNEKLKLFLDNPPFIKYNTLVTWFKKIVKFDFSNYGIG